MFGRRLSKDSLVFGVSLNVLVLGIVSPFADMSTEMIYPLIPLFLVNVLGATFIDVGLIEGVAESPASIVKIVSGYLSDRFGKRKPRVYSGYAIAAIAKPACICNRVAASLGQYGSWIALARALETQRVTLLFSSQRAWGEGHSASNALSIRLEPLSVRLSRWPCLAS
jgi:MFS family permease